MRFLLSQLRVDFKIHCGLKNLRVDLLIPLVLAALRQSIVKHGYSVDCERSGALLLLDSGAGA